MDRYLNSHNVASLSDIRNYEVSGFTNFNNKSKTEVYNEVTVIPDTTQISHLLTNNNFNSAFTRVETPFMTYLSCTSLSSMQQLVLVTNPAIYCFPAELDAGASLRARLALVYRGPVLSASQDYRAAPDSPRLSLPGGLGSVYAGGGRDKQRRSILNMENQILPSSHTRLVVN